MNETSLEPVEPLQSDTVSTNQETSKARGRTYFSSTFIRRKQLLVKGESRESKSDKRNACIVLFDPATGDAKGRLSAV